MRMSGLTEQGSSCCALRKSPSLVSLLFGCLVDWFGFEGLKLIHRHGLFATIEMYIKLYPTALDVNGWADREGGKAGR
jgi:hypothetical protein